MADAEEVKEKRGGITLELQGQVELTEVNSAEL